MRFATTTLVIAVVLSAAVAHAAPPALKVGQVWNVEKSGVIAASSLLWFDEIMDSLVAKDTEGLTQMVAQDRALPLRPGVQLRILTLHPKGDFRKFGYAECRAILDGKAVAKVCVAEVFFASQRRPLVLDDGDADPEIVDPLDR